MQQSTNAPTAFIISTGSEITHGVYADTNAMHLSRLLKDHGFRVTGHAAAPDDANAIHAALQYASAQSELLIVTGGLGPTEDDLNREILSDFTRRPLHYVHRPAAMMQALFNARGREMPERNLKQACVPEGSDIMLNFWGTAPGFIIPAANGLPVIVAMPGVPVEWRGMVGRYFTRLILKHFPQRPHFASHIIRLADIPESEVNALLLPLFTEDHRIEIGLLAQGGIISVRLTAAASTREAANTILAIAAEKTRQSLPQENIFWDASETGSLEQRVVALLRHNEAKVTFAESCTGGGVARRITSVPGSSDVLDVSYVTYSDTTKTTLLGVRPETIAKHGAVSAQCAREMAEGALTSSKAGVAVAVTGIAGPTGAVPGKPVGTVWFALASQTGTGGALVRQFPGDREEVRNRAEIQALEMLRRYLEHGCIG